MDLCIVGTGYVGLVTGTCFSVMGNIVHFYDSDESKLANIAQGEIPFYEPRLQELLLEGIQKKRIHFYKELREVPKSDFYFVCVGTPQSNDSGKADISAVINVAEALKEKLYRETAAFVIKSTVPVGTAGRIRSMYGATKIDVLNNPEFLKEGSAVSDFMKPERVVVGISPEYEEKHREELEEKMNQLYAPFVRTGKPVLFMSNESAEMSKLAANAMLACRISLMNEIANICEATWANVDDVRRSVGEDSRIGKAFLFPGVGYGGSCFPKDVRALAYLGKEQGLSTRLLNAVDEVNSDQIWLFFNKIARYFGSKRGLSKKRIAIWGLSFKPNTDDTREAPAHTLISLLLERKAEVAVYDPKGMPNSEKVFGDRVIFLDEKYSCCKGADALCVITEWPEFRTVDFEKIKDLMNKPAIFDGRNIYDSESLGTLGFKYFGVGKNASYT